MSTHQLLGYHFRDFRLELPKLQGDIHLVQTLQGKECMMKDSSMDNLVLPFHE